MTIDEIDIECKKLFFDLCIINHKITTTHNSKYILKLNKEYDKVTDEIAHLNHQREIFIKNEERKQKLNMINNA